MFVNGSLFLLNRYHDRFSNCYFPSQRLNIAVWFCLFVSSSSCTLLWGCPHWSYLWMGAWVNEGPQGTNRNMSKWGSTGDHKHVSKYQLVQLALISSWRCDSSSVGLLNIAVWFRWFCSNLCCQVIYSCPIDLHERSKYSSISMHTFLPVCSVFFLERMKEAITASLKGLVPCEWTLVVGCHSP